ncbi:MAG: hypothetical protein WD766_04855 [Gemmatimonadota bacterium]
MRTFILGVIVTAAALGLAPERAEAQQAGWWEWALQEFDASRRGGDIRFDPRPGDRDDEEWEDDERDGARRGGGLGDIIFGGPDQRRDGRGQSSRRAGAGSGEGPPFCRNGQGHPVFGRDWCYERGFGLGARDIRWDDRGWEDVIFGGQQRQRSGSLDRGGLADVLGDVIYGRILDVSRATGGNEPLVGRWLRPGGSASVLQVRAGSLPIAELSDVDGDGRVDAVLTPRR